jgi:CheY-like chemotaxis protein
MTAGPGAVGGGAPAPPPHQGRAGRNGAGPPPGREPWAKVLVVDDNAANVALLERLLEGAHLGQLHAFTDPRKALEHCAGQLPDMVLLDLHMPHLDGFAVMEALRAMSPADRFLPDVVLTADDTDQLTPAQIQDRLRAATAWLRERHTAKHLVPMTALTMSKPTGVPAVGAGVAVRWSPNQLVIERQGGSPITRATPATWLAPDRPMCRNCTEVCHNDAFLGAAFIDVERTLALILVSYHGSDTCWEPSSQAHAVVW